MECSNNKKRDMLISMSLVDNLLFKGQMMDRESCPVSEFHGRNGSFSSSHRRHRYGCSRDGEGDTVSNWFLSLSYETLSGLT